MHNARSEIGDETTMPDVRCASGTLAMWAVACSRGRSAMAEYTVRLYFRGGMTLDVPIMLADDEEPDLEWFLGESSETSERTPVLSEGQFAWKASEVLAAEWYEDEDEPETSAISTLPDAEPVTLEDEATDDKKPADDGEMTAEKKTE